MELSEKCVGWSVAKGKRGKKRQKVDNAYLSQLSDYAAEVLPIIFKGNQIIKSFFTQLEDTLDSFMRSKIWGKIQTR